MSWVAPAIGLVAVLTCAVATCGIIYVVTMETGKEIAKRWRRLRSVKIPRKTP